MLVWLVICWCWVWAISTLFFNVLSAVGVLECRLVKLKGWLAVAVLIVSGVVGILR
jgi:hypothetical protein